MKVRNYLFATMLVLVWISQSGAATRRGFIARLEAGGGFVSTKAENPQWHNPQYSLSKGGGGSVFALGYAPTDQIIIHGSLRTIYYGEHAPLAFFLGPMGILVEDGNVLAMVGVSYYSRPGIPSWFVEAGVGAGEIGNPFGDRLLSNDDQEASALFGGIGYEFLRHYHVELEFFWMRGHTGLNAREGRWTSLTAMLTVGVTVY